MRVASEADGQWKHEREEGGAIGLLTVEDRQQGGKWRDDVDLTCSCLLVVVGLTACALIGDR